MDQAIGLGGAIIGIVAGGVVGFNLGRRYRQECRRARFWIASAVSVLLGMIVMFAGFMTSVVFISGAGVGLMTGGLNGLRWGMGRLSDVPRRRPPAPAQREGQASREPSAEHRENDQTPHPAT